MNMGPVRQLNGIYVMDKNQNIYIKLLHSTIYIWITIILKRRVKQFKLLYVFLLKLKLVNMSLDI